MNLLAAIFIWVIIPLGGVILLFVLFDYIPRLISEKRIEKQYAEWLANFEALRSQFYPLNNSSYSSTNAYHSFLRGIQPVKIDFGQRKHLSICSGNIEYPENIEGVQITYQAYERFIKSVINSGRNDLFIANFGNEPGVICFVKEGTYNVNSGLGLNRTIVSESQPEYNIYSFGVESYGHGATWYIRVLQYGWHQFYLTAEEHLQGIGKIDPIRDFLTEKCVSAFRDELEAQKPTQEHVHGFEDSKGGRRVWHDDEDDEEELASSSPQQVFRPEPEPESSPLKQPIHTPVAEPLPLPLTAPSKTNPAIAFLTCVGLVGLFGTIIFFGDNHSAEEKAQPTVTTTVSADVTSTPVAEEVGNISKIDSNGSSTEEPPGSITEETPISAPLALVTPTSSPQPVPEVATPTPPQEPAPEVSKPLPTIATAMSQYEVEQRGIRISYPSDWDVSEKQTGDVYSIKAAIKGDYPLSWTLTISPDIDQNILDDYRNADSEKGKPENKKALAYQRASLDAGKTRSLSNYTTLDAVEWLYYENSQSGSVRLFIAKTCFKHDGKVWEIRRIVKSENSETYKDVLYKIDRDLVVPNQLQGRY